MRASSRRPRLGQHFLNDDGVIDALIREIRPRPGQSVVEIGPGLSALTQPLVERLGALTVIELDRNLAQRLREHPQLTVVENDVLKVDFAQIKQSLCATKLRIVGNLPYYISTPILFHLFDAVEDIEDQHFMLQKDVVDRLVARPCTASYGRLSVVMQWRYDVEKLIEVSPASFNPPPQVHSAVVRMTPFTNPIPVHRYTLEEVVKVAFSQRRKRLRHTLGQWLETKNLSFDFDLQRRAEEVSVAEYVALAGKV